MSPVSGVHVNRSQYVCVMICLHFVLLSVFTASRHCVAVFYICVDCFATYIPNLVT